MTAGIYVVTIEANDVVRHRETIELPAGVTTERAIELARGRTQVFEISLPDRGGRIWSKRGRNRGKVDVELTDASGEPVLFARRAADYFDADRRALRLSFQLRPGSYVGRFVDQRFDDDADDRPTARVELVVPERGEVRVVRVDVR